MKKRGGLIAGNSPPDTPPPNTGSDFAFQWSMPGVIAATADSPKIYAATAKTLVSFWTTLLTNPTVGSLTLQFWINGVLSFSKTVSADTWSSISPPVAMAVGQHIQLRVTDIASGNAAGLWVGLSEIASP